MHLPLLTALRLLQQDVAAVLDKETIFAACRAVGYSRWRKRLLDPAATIHWFLAQVLAGNTALQHVSLLAKRAFTDVAFGKARQRLPLKLFKEILRRLNVALAPQLDSESRWRGHRLFLTDGSTFSMPDVPCLRDHFGQPGGQAAGLGFPLAKFFATFHAATGALIEVFATKCRTHELSQIEDIDLPLQEGDVLVADRGFCSFVHLAMLLAKKAHAILRLHQTQIVDFTFGRPHFQRSEARKAKAKAKAKGKKSKGAKAEARLPRSQWLESLGPFDQLVRWFKPRERPKWMSVEAFAALPCELTLRELRYQVGRAGFRTQEVTLVTTLLDPKSYPADELSRVYGTRWNVEGHLRDLKQTMKMDVLKSKTVEGILKEMYMFAIAYNLVRLVMLEAARKQGTTPDRISFQDALRWLSSPVFGASWEELPQLVVNPDRRGRAEPRVRKRRPKDSKLMKRPRAKSGQVLARQAKQAAAA